MAHKLRRQVYTKDKFLGKNIFVYVEPNGFFTTKYSKNIHSFPSDAIIEAKKIIRKRKDE